MRPVACSVMGGCRIDCYRVGLGCAECLVGKRKGEEKREFRDGAMDSSTSMVRELQN